MDWSKVFVCAPLNSSFNKDFTLGGNIHHCLAMTWRMEYGSARRKYMACSKSFLLTLWSLSLAYLKTFVALIADPTAAIFSAVLPCLTDRESDDLTDLVTGKAETLVIKSGG
ncbi:hypothetical protein SODALDRAFT_355004 [Sodiomyces alkalinus F11]|uniref:Uncharacterized protein n=1 Tax=Sodiomyces alkalinus (strain CBS 110278 / VKM F-3762 / F11) TaxID=1314773 RepID=A0A3N2Q822_SODAK|nr:hypothetical protein SODALDRAFT_355004 [Sodiomyces alkalinus F11]ROT42818.1 hypothetical protein SODALDRAFT_355004 [Sodiomyces alkalinus F11]